MKKKILVSQPRPSSDKSPYFDIARKHDVDIIFHPFIKVESLSPAEFRQQRVQILDHSAIVFTSRHAIDHFFQLCRDLRVTMPEDMKYFAISEAIALYIQKFVQYRKRKVFFPTVSKLPDLVNVMAKHRSERYLIPQSDVHSSELHTLLAEKELHHTECVMYRTVSNPCSEERLREMDMVILFTPAGVSSLLSICPEVKDSGIKLGCFGKATAKAIEEAGLTIALEAPTAEAPSMTGSLDLYLERKA